MNKYTSFYNKINFLNEGLEKEISWDISMIQTVEIYEKHSKCAAKKVCCIIASDSSVGHNILSIGLNGTTPGSKNCCDIWERSEDGWLKYGVLEEDEEAHHKWSLTNEIHAEVNALAKCTHNGISTRGTIAYISYSPCFNCAKILVAFGIRKIVFARKYDLFDSEVRTFLKENNIEIVHITKDETGNYLHNKL